MKNRWEVSIEKFDRKERKKRLMTSVVGIIIFLTLIYLIVKNCV